MCNTYPDGKEDRPSRTVRLDAKVATAEAVGHKVGTNRVITRMNCNFVIPVGNVGYVCVIPQVVGDAVDCRGQQGQCKGRR